MILGNKTFVHPNVNLVKVDLVSEHFFDLNFEQDDSIMD